MTIFSGAKFFPPQVPSDNLNSEFVFEGVPPDDSIVSAVATVIPDDHTLTIVSTTFVGNTVVIRITGGTAGITYQINVTATTAAGLVWDRTAMLPIVANFPAVPPAPYTGPTGPSATRNRTVFGDLTSGNALTDNTFSFVYNPNMLDVYVYLGQGGIKLLPGDTLLPYTATDGTSIVFTDIAATEVFAIEFISWL